ncbi:hypothetical protein V1281_001512 [Nitrobacteraceae bacterium AZCC 2161]
MIAATRSVIVAPCGSLCDRTKAGRRRAVSPQPPHGPVAILPEAGGALALDDCSRLLYRLHLPFAALAFSAVVSLMPGFFLFNAATGFVELVSIGPSAPAALLTSIAANGAMAFLIIMAMTFGLILPRMLFERVLPAPA